MPDETKGRGSDLALAGLELGLDAEHARQHGGVLHPHMVKSATLRGHADMVGTSSNLVVGAV